MRAAVDLGLHDSQLYDWRQKAKLRRSQSEVEQSQATEIARLKRQVAEQAEELAIVEKAATYFAKNQKRSTYLWPLIPPSLRLRR